MALLTIELYARDPERARVATSELEFKEHDTPAARWASAGVVVAALVAAQGTAPSEPATEAEPRLPVPKQAPAAEKQAPTPPPAKPLWLRLDLGASFGSEDRQRPLRWGALGRFGVAFSQLPVFAFGTCTYTRRAGSPELAWLGTSLGFGFRVDFLRRRAALDVRGEGVLESVGIRATDGAREAQARRTRWGPRLGLDLSGYLAGDLALVVGAEAAALGPAVVIDVAGNTVERLPPFVWGFISVLRYDFR